MSDVPQIEDEEIPEPPEDFGHGVDQPFDPDDELEPEVDD